LDVAASSSRVRTILRLLPTEWVGTPRSDEDDFEADKLTLTVERIDGGKLRCTGATWSDTVVIFPGEVLAFQNIERQAHALRAPAPGTVVETPPAAAPTLELIRRGAALPGTRS
jgi:hypothetical protein